MEKKNFRSSQNSEGGLNLELAFKKDAMDNSN